MKVFKNSFKNIIQLNKKIKWLKVSIRKTADLFNLISKNIISIPRLQMNELGDEEIDKIILKLEKKLGNFSGIFEKFSELLYEKEKDFRLIYENLKDRENIITQDFHLYSKLYEQSKKFYLKTNEKTALKQENISKLKEIQNINYEISEKTFESQIYNLSTALDIFSKEESEKINNLFYEIDDKIQIDYNQKLQKTIKNDTKIHENDYNEMEIMWSLSKTPSSMQMSLKKYNYQINNEIEQKINDSEADLNCRVFSSDYLVNPGKNERYNSE